MQFSTTAVQFSIHCLKKSDCFLRKSFERPFSTSLILNVLPLMKCSNDLNKCKSVGAKFLSLSLSLYIYIYIYIYMHVSLNSKDKFCLYNLIKILSCFLGFRLEFTDEFTKIVPSAFGPFIGHHQGFLACVKSVVFKNEY